MAERDYRVTYKTREIDPRDDDRYEDPRRRVPTALDPYRYPDDRDELKRNVALAKARAASRYDTDDYRDLDASVRRDTVRDDFSSSTIRGVPRPATTKTTYSVTSAGIEKESEVKTRATTQARGPSAAASTPSMPRRTDYREHDDYDLEWTSTVPVRSSLHPSTRPYDDREYSRMERVYDVERPRKENGVYMIDARDADVYVSGDSRDFGRDAAEYRSSAIGDEYWSSQTRIAPSRVPGSRQSEVVYSNRDNYRSSAPSIHVDSPYMSGARSERPPPASRSQTTLHAPSRSSARVCEDDRTTTATQGPSRQSTRRDEEDFTFVERRDTRAPSIHESFRDPFHDDTSAPETLRGRTRASMNTISPFEDKYVVASPPQQRSGTNARGPSTGESLRSSMVKDDTYTPEERRQRRRSRSITFRAHEADDHYAGDKYHQPPGAEAAECGRYLKHYGDERDRMDFEYSSRSSKRGNRDYAYRSRGSQREERDYERRDRDSIRYAPQKMRSGSRKRRGSDDESYVSKYQEKTTKTTYY